VCRPSGTLSIAVHHTQRAVAASAPETARPVRARPVADVVIGRRLVLGNDDVRIFYTVATGTSPLYRNAIGDECVYVESGAATYCERDLHPRPNR
jgi:hypothetical protein